MKQIVQRYHCYGNSHYIVTYQSMWAYTRIVIFCSFWCLKWKMKLETELCGAFLLINTSRIHLQSVSDDAGFFVTHHSDFMLTKRLKDLYHRILNSPTDSHMSVQLLCHVLNNIHSYLVEEERKMMKAEIECKRTCLSLRTPFFSAVFDYVAPFSATVPAKSYCSAMSTPPSTLCGTVNSVSG